MKSFLLRPFRDLTAAAAKKIAMKGYLKSCAGDYLAAQRLLRRAISIRDLFGGEGHLAAGPIWNNLGEAYRKNQQFDEAQGCYRRALEIYERKQGSAAQFANAYNNLALALNESVYRDDVCLDYETTQELLSKAEHLYLKALDLKKTYTDQNSTDLANTYNNIGAFYVDCASESQTQEEETAFFSKAEDAYNKAIEILENTDEAEDGSHWAALIHNIATFKREQGKYDEAEGLYRRALDAWTDELGLDHPHTATCRECLEQVVKLNETARTETFPR